MNLDSQNHEPQPVDKGKRRAADATEQTPLLSRPSQSYTQPDDAPGPVTYRRRLLSKLLLVFLVSSSICIAALAFIAILAWSYASRASGVSPNDILNDAVVFQGPNRVDVLKLTPTGILVNVQGKIGCDAGAVIGIGSEPEDGLFQGIWKSVGRWGVQRVQSVSVNLSTVRITSGAGSSFLASVEFPPIEVPLTADPPSNLSWLQDISIPVMIHPTSNSSLLIAFLRDTWKEGAVSITAATEQIDVTGGSLNDRNWRTRIHRELFDVQTSLRIKIPPLPGIPNPGRDVPFPSVADLITLLAFNVYVESDTLALSARATLVDPVPPTLSLTTPSLPFLVSLPATSSQPVPIASVSTDPFALTHPNITLNISGTVLPLATDAVTSLSSFLSRYLSGLPNDIIITSPLLPGVSVDADFPAPHPRPQILRNVTLNHMKIKPGTPFLASGTIFARVVLPAGMTIGVDVKRVLPDVLVFDGEVSDNVEPPASPPLPDPLPGRAFGRIRPDDWLESQCEPDQPQEGEGSAFIVSANIVDVPLEVLPGRQKEFSNFVSKVIFGTDGAIAGILGTAAIGVTVEGLTLHGPGEQDGIEFNGLPFRGSVRVGKKDLFSDTVVRDKWRRIVDHFMHSGR